jgi:eukaryotic-like serine/threonine-protein kinase
MCPMTLSSAEGAKPLDRIGDRYEIEGTLGSGGMSTVFAGRDLLLDRPVAMKLLPVDKRQNERASQRLRREARAMARITHPGVVQVFDHGHDARLGPYIVMERLIGKDLSVLMHERAPLELSVALGFAEQFCTALQAAHAAGVVHRDLKPSNLFVLDGPATTPARIKVLDFGVAKLDDPGQLTDPGDILGTLAYLPPERWETGETADARGDIYALGAIVYEMLSGAPPFRAPTRAALRLSILHDDARPLSQIRPELPRALTAAVARALSKSPADRFQSAWEFALALGVPFQRLEPSAARAETGNQFAGTDRYRVLRSLARGQGTEIYAAWDIEQNVPVALKQLLVPAGESLARLKREFRALSDVEHRNVARAHGLVEQGAHVLLVLELIEGAPLLEYLQNAPGELHACLCQLAHALSALHAQGIVHGDVTPQNVLVEPSGRLVLLDCGLSSQAREGAAPRGTKGYLAPEVLEGRVGTEADFYALGAVICRALTGELPGARPPHVSLRDWLHTQGGPEWSSVLGELCERLLEPDPERRASETDVLDALGIARENRASRPHSIAHSARFVGRDDALSELWQAFQRSTDEGSTVLWLQGTSGIGKTTLLDHFGRMLERQGAALVLRGRARHSVAIPFPAFDEFIDGLSEWLMAQTPATVAEVLPRNTQHLARLFPVLRRIPAVARSTSSAPGPADAGYVRLQATDALRELIRRLCARQPLVLMIDDVQWLDGHSAELLAAVLRNPDPPPLLLIGAVRTDQGELDPVLRKLETRLRGPAQTLRLDPLSDEEARALVRMRWRGEQPLEEEAARRLARQSGGNPYFADLLAESLVLPNVADLDAVLRARQDRLPADSRLALELLCVAARPLRRELLARAAASRDPHVLAPLVAGGFARVAHTAAGDALEPYHGRIREAVVQALSARKRQAHHRSLAETLRRDPGTEPEALVEHLAGSGEADEAASLALAAAQNASEQLAFDRAAALFGVALEHGQFDAAQAKEIRGKRARALQNAGRRREAGKELMSAALLASAADERNALQREAASHLLMSGDTRWGLEAVGPAISRAGLNLPETPGDTVAATLGALQALAVRGMDLRVADSVLTDGELERIDLCLLLAQGLAHVDLRALPFAIQALQLALDAGETERLQRASAVFVISTVSHVPNPLTGPALDLCRRMTRKLATPYARALLLAAEAETALSQGEFLAAEANFERSERILLESCVGATRELAVVRDMAVFIQYAHKGDFRTQVARTQRWLREAEETQDQFHTSMLRVAHAIVWIAHDRPEQARSELDRAEAEWTGAAGILAVVATLYRDIVDRYTHSDRPGQELRAELLASPAAQTPFLAGYVELHTIWRAIGTVARNGSGAPAELAIARESLAKLRNFGLEVWLGVADALEANLDYLRGERETSLQRLEESEQTFRRLHMLCLAACARKRRGQFMHAELGARLQLEADTQLQQLGIVDVERWSQAYWSVFDANTSQLLTYVSDEASSDSSSSDGF